GWAAAAPPDRLAVRHTVGLLDPITAADVPSDGWLRDCLPQTLEECIERHGLDHFKVKVGGTLDADLDRLTAIAATLDRLIPGPYVATLDGNEQYKSMDDFARLVDAMLAAPAPAPLGGSIAFILPRPAPAGWLRSPSPSSRSTARSRWIPAPSTGSPRWAAAFPCSSTRATTPSTRSRAPSPSDTLASPPRTARA